MDSGYDSDCGYAEFICIPAVQVYASCTYEEYCTRTKHVKGKKATQGTGRLKNKVITFHANDLRGLTDLKLVIRAVGVGEQVFVLNPDPPYSKQIVVSNELSIKFRYVEAIS